MPLPLLFLGGAALAGGAAALWNNNNKPKAPQQTSQPAKGFTPLAKAPAISSIAPDWKGGAEARAMERQTAAIYAQIAAMPKLPTYNTADAWARASNSAASSVNPVYQDKLNNKLAEFRANVNQATVNTTRGKEDLATSLRQSVEDINLNRDRTTQDVASKIAESQYQEGRFQDTEGTEFDKANREARTATAISGLTESGLGQQALEEMQTTRNENSADQVRTFENSRQAQELFKTRTFEDLATTETRKTQLTTRQQEDLDIELGNFIENTGIQETQFRHQNESERLGAIYDATKATYGNDIRQWLGGLQGQGLRSQDIEAAYRVYGGEV